MCQRILKGKIRSCYYCLGQYVNRKISRRYIDVSCIMITCSISSNFCKKRFSGIFLALQFSILLVSSFIEDFLFISFQQKNEIKKGNTLMELEYLLSCSRIDLFDVKYFKKTQQMELDQKLCLKRTRCCSFHD